MASSPTKKNVSFELLPLHVLPSVHLQTDAVEITVTGMTEEGAITSFEHVLTRYLQLRDNLLPTPPVELDEVKD